MQNRIAAGVLLAIVAQLASHDAVADLKDATVAFRSGNWKVLRDKNTMTDKTDCTGIYKEDYGVQLVKDQLFVRVAGGIESVTLRFGDEPARPLRLPTEMEKKVRVIIVSGADFERLRDVSRLLYQSSTLVSGIKSGEIDLIGFGPALDNIRAGCPDQSSVPAAGAAAQTPNNLTGTMCNSALVARMQQNGLKDSQILAICQ